MSAALWEGRYASARRVAQNDVHERVWVLRPPVEVAPREPAIRTQGLLFSALSIFLEDRLQSVVRAGLTFTAVDDCGADARRGA